MSHFWAPPCPASHLLPTVAQGEAHSHHTQLTLTPGVNWLTPNTRAEPAQVPSQPSPALAVAPLCTCSVQHSSGGPKETPFPATTTQQGQFPPSPLVAFPN